MGNPPTQTTFRLYPTGSARQICNCTVRRQRLLVLFGPWFRTQCDHLPFGHSLQLSHFKYQALVNRRQTSKLVEKLVVFRTERPILLLFTHQRLMFGVTLGPHRLAHEIANSLCYTRVSVITGLRLSEALALRWDAIDLKKKQVHVCRTVALGKFEERTKTGYDRFVLLNHRALHALEFARQHAERRKKGVGRILSTPYVFPPSKNSEYVKQTSDLHKQWRPTLKTQGIRYRPPYNCRHTYATICLMSGLNPAFISQQLGHSVQVLLSTYARWISSSSDWGELEKLQIGIKTVSAQTRPP